MITLPTVILALALTTVAIAILWSAISDVRAYVIPNTASILIVASFLITALFTPWAPLTAGLISGFGVLVVGLILFALGWMGGGDIKLFTALAFWCGPGRLAPFTLVICLAGAALGLFMLSPLRRFAPAASDAARGAVKQPMPYGVAIAVGGAWVLTQYAPFLG